MELNDLLAQIDSLKGEIDKLRPLKPEVEHRIMQKFYLDWNYHSNAIEGNTLTLGETKVLLEHDLTPAGKPQRFTKDMIGHNEVIRSLPRFIEEKRRLDEKEIKNFHTALLREPYEKPARAPDGQLFKLKVRLGDYKKERNVVTTPTGATHEFALPEDVSPKMYELLEWHRDWEQKRDVHVVLHAAEFHHRFVGIHPFDDGNGRMGRILMNLILMEQGFPPVIILDRERDSYIAALVKADVRELDDLKTLITRKQTDSLELYLRGAHGESIEDADDVDKEVALLKQELRIAPQPIDLSLEIQKRHFDEQLIPFLQRLDAKLAQFDELFAKPLGELTHESRDVRGMHLGGRTFRGKRREVPELLREFSHNQTLLIYGRLGFFLDGFLRDGPNDFSVSLGFDIHYEQRKMVFNCSEPKIKRQMLYSEWFSEDELKAFVTDFTKTVLNKIEQQLSKNRPKQ